MPFVDIIAQDIAVHMLRRSILEEQVSHAYLFLGPEGVGKRTTALTFAKALNCTDAAARAAGDACGSCRSCRMIALGQHPDVRLLTPETTGGKTVIPIDAIRTRIGENPSHPLPLREDAQRKPLEGRHKVYILDPANRPGLQEDAGNALLLTLEEPPPHVVIILISSRPSAVLPTLVSRCCPVRFHLAPREAVDGALAQHATLEPGQRHAIAGMASGRVGWALGVAASPAILEARKRLISEIIAILPAGRPGALRLAELLRTLATSQDLLAAEDEEGDGKAKTSADRTVRRNLPELLDIVGSVWRDMLVLRLGDAIPCINADFAAQLTERAPLLNEASLRDGLQTVMNTKRLIERNANIDLALEAMWMRVLTQQ